MTTAMQLLGAVLGFDSDLNLKPAGLIVFATVGSGACESGN